MEKVNEYVYPYHWGIIGFYKEFYEHPLSFVIPYLDPNSTVLEAGCGDGRLTSLYASKVKKVVAVDNQELPLSFARLIFNNLGILNVSFKKANITSLPFSDGSFDSLLSFDVIEHVPVDVLPTVIKEYFRVLRPGGYFFITTPNRKELRGRIFGHKTIDKHYYEYSIPELRKLFSPCVLEVSFKGIYVPFPFPKAEHFSNIIPFRYLFRFLIRLGRYLPSLSTALLIIGRKK
ncbi:methyltransferase domain-containing protein [Candidatus Woesearchaeota archaeon]|nr:methyltransferase domain-containing protein [Candidatus Woesearchaeota archaeon]